MLKVDPTARIYQPTVILDDEKHHVEIGSDCAVGQFCFIACRELIMSRSVQIAPQVTLSGGGRVTLGSYSSISFGARIIPSSVTTVGKFMNDKASPEDHAETIQGEIVICEGAYIGANAVICVTAKHPSIHVGVRSVVCAGTYLDRDVPDETIVKRGPDGKLVFTLRD